MAAFLDFSWFTNQYASESKFIKYATRYTALFALVIYFLFLFNTSKNDDYLLSGQNVALYLVGIFVPLLIFCYFIFTSVEDKKYLGLVVLMALTLLIILLRTLLPSFDTFLRGFAKFMTDVTPLPPLSDTNSFLVVISLKLILICMILVALSILYNVFLNEAYRTQGTLGFLLYILFYIPCAISDYLKYLFVELKTTPQVVYVLLLIEIALILLYFYIPKWFSKLIFTDSVELIHDPIYFYGKQTISNIEPFYRPEELLDPFGKEFSKEELEEREDDYKISTNYAISMWMTTNPPSYSPDDENMMFRYGLENDENEASSVDSPLNGAPYISCMGNGQWKFVVSNNVYELSANIISGSEIAGNLITENVITEIDGDSNLINEKSLENMTVTLDVPMQRWNYIVMNYNSDSVDLFFNGILERTVDLGENRPIYTHDMKVCIGSEKNDLHGAICNLRVYQKPLSLNQITQTYNILNLKNPPLNNLN